MVFRFIDLFAGIGGIRLGLESALDDLNVDYQCVKSCEIDPQACLTYESNFNDNPAGDVRSLEITEDYDMLLAGFPCQPFSYAGKRQGFGDTRGTLFFEIERILRETQPKCFLLENVRGLITHDGGRTFKTIITKLESLNYGVKYLLLNSSDYGVPQNRVRLYILGILNKKPIITLKSDVGAADSHKYKLPVGQTTLFDSECKVTVSSIIEDSVDPMYNCSDEFVSKLIKNVGDDYSKLNGVRLIDYRGGNSIHSWQLGVKGDCSEEEIEFMNMLIQNRRKHIFGTHQDGKKLSLDQIKTFYKKDDIMDVIASLIEKGYLKEESGLYNPVCGNMSFEVFKFLDPDSICITLTSSDCNRLGIVHNNIIRRITPRECARLQGFPDTFIIHPDDEFAYKQFGNSVSVPVVKTVLLNLFNNNPELFD